jgi:hypothetical protein
MSLSNSQLATISQQIYQKFPELKGVSPQIQNQSTPKSAGNGGHYLMIYKGKTAQNIVRVVRVTADAKGRVLKMSTSR